MCECTLRKVVCLPDQEQGSLMKKNIALETIYWDYTLDQQFHNYTNGSTSEDGTKTGAEITFGNNNIWEHHSFNTGPKKLLSTDCVNVAPNKKL